MERIETNGRDHLRYINIPRILRKSFWLWAHRGRRLRGQSSTASCRNRHRKRQDRKETKLDERHRKAEKRVEANHGRSRNSVSTVGESDWVGVHRCKRPRFLSWARRKILMANRSRGLHTAQCRIVINSASEGRYCDT